MNFPKLVKERFNVSQGIFLSFFLIYSLFILSTCLGLRGFVPDEYSFYNQALNYAEQIRTNGLIHFFKIRNYNAYGSIYWTYYTSLIFLFKDMGFWIMRLSSGLMLVSVPLILYFFPVKRSLASWIALVFMSFPGIWWQGKVTGPEIFSAFWGFIAIYLLLQKRDVSPKSLLVSWLLLGFATGIKLTALPLVFYAFILDFKGRKSFSSRVKKLSNYFCMFLIGFIFSNPFIIHSPKSFLNEFIGVKSFHGNLISHIDNIFNGHIWLWDIVYSGGFFNLSLPIYLFLFCILFSLFFSKFKLNVLGYLFTFLISIAMYSKSQIFFGWYSLPLILSLPFIFLHIRPIAKIELVFAVVFLINIFAHQKIYSEQFENLKWKWRIQNNLYKDFFCLDELMSNLLAKDTSLLIDFSETALHTYSKRSKRDNLDLIVGINAYRVLNGYDYEFSRSNKTLNNNYDGVIFLLGKRIQAMSNLSLTQIEEMIQSQFHLKGPSVRYSCPSTNILYVTSN